MINVLQILMIAIFALGSLVHAAGEQKFDWDPLDI